MSAGRLSKLQRFILATAWENCRANIEKEGAGSLRVYVDEIYNGYYRYSKSGPYDRYPHKFAVSISRSLKQLKGAIAKRIRHGGETAFIVFRPEKDIIQACRACWKEGGLKLTALVNNKDRAA